MFEIDGNDASMIASKAEGRVVYFKNDYGFIRPKDTKFDDIFFHVKDVEPWRKGFKIIKGEQKEREIRKDDGSKVIIPYFPGEKVRFDIKESGKTIQTRFGPKKGFKAINVELLTQFEGSELIEGTEKNERKV